MISMKVIARVSNLRKDMADDFWGEVVSVIELAEEFEETSLEGIETFSHVEIFYVFHLVKDEKIQYKSRHPRNNHDWPKVGIFAQRGKNRPNRIGATIVKLLKREGRKIIVAGLDAIDGTPIIDIKPVMREFLPSEDVKQPVWSIELMKNYWG